MLLSVFAGRGQEIGQIDFDKGKDKGIEICGRYIFQQYNGLVSYDGGIKAIREKLLNKIENPLFEQDQSGYITVRFLVNCKGETDRFRIKMVDREMQSSDFNLVKVDTLVNHVKLLDKWLVREAKSGPSNSYYQVIFKIDHGIISDIF